MLHRPVLCVVATLALAATLFFMPSASSRADNQPKRVLMLHSFGLRFKPWTDYAQIIRSEITRNANRAIDFHDHSLVNARLNDDQADQPFVSYLQSLYGATPPDLIVALGAPAANFVQRYRDSIFPGTPMLFTVVEARRVQYDKLTVDDTVSAVAHDFPASFQHILRVLPGTKMIAVVNGTSPNEKFWQGELERETASVAGRVQLKFYNRLSFEEILKDAAQLPPHSAIFWHLMNVDAAGVAHEANAALSKLAAIANAPIFSYIDNFFGDGTSVGGPMHSVEEGSVVAAAVAVRILNGEKPGEIKTPPPRYAAPRYDWQQLHRWGINERDLPPRSTVLFKPHAIWETYRWELTAVTMALLLQGIVILLLAVERHRRQWAEVEARQRMTELAHVNRFSTAGEMAASIAHEINQPLGATLNNVETAKMILRSQEPDLKEVEDIVNDIGRDNRRAAAVISRLRSYVKKVPSERKTFDLNDDVIEAVRFLSPEAKSRNVSLRTKLTAAPLRVNGDPIQLGQVLSNLVLNAFDAVSEGGQVRRAVRIKTKRVGNFAEVSIADSGPGVPPDAMNKVFDPFYSTKEHGMGMGLSIVRTIVEAHDGSVQVENGSGAVFRVRLPLA